VNWQKRTVQVSPSTRKECPTKLGLMHLQSNVSHFNENIATLWVRLNSSKSDHLRTTAFSTSTKCKSQGKYIFWICWSPLSRRYKKLG